MSIIKELDDWLNSGKKGSNKKIFFDNTELHFYWYFLSERISVSVIKYDEKMLSINFNFKESELNANSLLEFTLRKIYDNAKYLQASGDEIGEIWIREYK